MRLSKPCGGILKSGASDSELTQALLERAHGRFRSRSIAYWPKAPKTWESVGGLNRELRRMSPWLVAKGSQFEVKSSLPEVQVRAKTVVDGKTGIVLLINTTSEPRSVEITIPQLPTKELRSLFDAHSSKPVKIKFTEKLQPYDTRVYTWGEMVPQGDG